MPLVFRAWRLSRLPADQGLRLHHSQRLAPVEPAREPDQGEAGGVSSALRLDMALLVESELFAQEEIFGRLGGRWTQTQQPEAHGILQKRQQCAHSLHAVMEQAQYAQHTQGTLLRQKHHSWLLSLLGESLSSDALPCTPYGRSAS